MTKFLLYSLLVCTVILASTYAGVNMGAFSQPSFTRTIIGFLCASSALIYYLLLKRSKGPSFTQYYLLSVVGKFCGFGIFMLIIIYADRKGAPENVVLFMVSYVCLTALEVGFLFRKING